MKIHYKKITIGIIIAASGTVIGGLILSGINKINPGEAILLITSKIGRFLVAVFTFPIPVWGVVLIIGGLFGVLWIAEKLSETPSINYNQKPDWWDNYRMDYFFDLLFIWDYGENVYSRIGIHNLRQICPECKCEIQEQSYNLICPNCDTKTVDYRQKEHDGYFEKIIKLIIHRIQSGEYKNTPFFGKPRYGGNYHE